VARAFSSIPALRENGSNGEMCSARRSIGSKQDSNQRLNLHRLARAKKEGVASGSRLFAVSGWGNSKYPAPIMVLTTTRS
jgi:hypothetical protein